MQRHQSTENDMSIMAFVSPTLPRRIARIDAGLVRRTERHFRLRVRPDGLDVAYSSRSAFDIDLGLAAGHAIDLGDQVSPGLAARIAASADRDADRFALIELTPVEAERLAGAIAKATPAAARPAIPVIDAYAPRNGLLVPVELIRNRLVNLALPTKKGSPMSHPLHRSAPEAYNLIKGICDDREKVIDEFILYELARAQGFCKRVDHIKGNKPPRAKTLTEAEIDAVAKPYAAEIARRKVSEIDEPLINPLPDGTLAIIPLFGQSDEANVLLLACFIAHGNPGSMRLALDIDEVLPAISREVLEGLGHKPNEQVSE